MKIKDDSVFQVSLTEIAFTLVILLILLLGSMIYQEMKEQEELQEKYLQLEQYGGICRPDPDDPLDPMMPCIKCVSVKASIDKEEARDAIDLGRKLLEQIKAHTEDKLRIHEIKQRLLSVASGLSQGEKILFESDNKELYEQLMQLQKDNQRLISERDTLLIEQQKLADEQQKLADEHQKLSFEHKDLLGNVAKYKELAKVRQNEAPPCWISDETTRVEYLFDIVINKDFYLVTAGDGFNIDNRKQEALNIPGVKEMLSKKSVTPAEFKSYAKQIYDYGRTRKPLACRFFVTMKSEIPDRKSADQARFTLENYFYKYEER